MLNEPPQSAALEPLWCHLHEVPAVGTAHWLTEHGEDIQRLLEGFEADPDVRRWTREQQLVMACLEEASHHTWARWRMEEGRAQVQALLGEYAVCPVHGQVDPATHYQEAHPTEWGQHLELRLRHGTPSRWNDPRDSLSLPWFLVLQALWFSLGGHREASVDEARERVWAREDRVAYERDNRLGEYR